MGRRVRQRSARDRPWQGREKILEEGKQLARYLSAGKAIRWELLGEDETRIILPAWADYSMVRDMGGGVSWRELQDLPAGIYDLWRAFRAGEAETMAEVASRRKREQEQRVQRV